MTGASPPPTSRMRMWLMGAVSFVESSFFPIPPDVMLIPMALARPDTAYLLRDLVHGDLGRSAASLGYADRRAALRLGRRLADSSLRLRQQGRDVPRGLCPMGRLDHPAQGPDADPVQDRHNHVRVSPATISVCSSSIVDHCPRHALFLLAFLLNRYGEQARHYHREASRIVGFSLAVLLVIGIAAALYLI